MMKNTGKAIGMDLGTTFSSISELTESGVMEIIPNVEGDSKTPSAVSFAGGQPVVGKSALPDLMLNPEYVIRCSKRYMGKTSKQSYRW